MLTYILTFYLILHLTPILAFYLTSILTFYLAFYLTSILTYLAFSLTFSSVGEVDKKGTRDKSREAEKFHALVQTHSYRSGGEH